MKGLLIVALFGFSLAVTAAEDYPLLDLGLLDSQGVEPISIEFGELAMLPPTSSAIARPSSSPQAQQYKVAGITEANKDVTLSLSIRGRIGAVNVKAGQWVEAGDLLLQFDRELERLEAERRRLIWKDVSALENAKLQVEIAKAIYLDTKQLHDESGAISGEELRNKRAEYLEQKSELSQLNIQEKREQLEYQLAQEKLNQGVLRAPFAGVVTKVWLDRGESAETNQPLCRLVDPKRGVFIANVEERLGRTLQAGEPVDLKIKAGAQDMAVTGEISYIAPVTDAASGLMELRVEFGNPNSTIKLGVGGYMQAQR